MSQNSLLYALIVILVVIVVAGVAWALRGRSPGGSPGGSPSGSPSGVHYAPMPQVSDCSSGQAGVHTDGAICVNGFWQLPSSPCPPSASVARALGDGPPLPGRLVGPTTKITYEKTWADCDTACLKDSGCTGWGFYKSLPSTANKGDANDAYSCYYYHPSNTGQTLVPPVTAGDVVSPGMGCAPRWTGTPKGPLYTTSLYTQANDAKQQWPAGSAAACQQQCVSMGDACAASVYDTNGGACFTYPPTALAYPPGAALKYVPTRTTYGVAGDLWSGEDQLPLV